MSRVFALFSVLAVLAQSTNIVNAQDCSCSETSDDAVSAEPCCGCSSGCGGMMGGTLMTRDYLFGDWHGARSGLEKHGIVPNLYLTQFYQGVTSGGIEQTSKYGGKLDYEFTFVGEKLGLNKGFTALLHAETRYGEAANFEAGLLSLPNLAMVYPFPGRQETSISGLIFLQALNEKFALTVGKYRTIDLFNMIYPEVGVRGIDGFMNFSMMLPATLFRTTNLSVNGAGVLAMKEEQIQSAVLVYDTQNSSTTIAPDLFDQGAVVLGYHRFFTEFGGKPGSQGFLANYSNRTYASTDPVSWTILPGEGLVVGRNTGSWTLAYFLDQVVWSDCCNEKRNVRLFSVWSLADRDPNPYRWTCNVSLQGTGLIRGRESDTMGVGYFFDGLNRNFKQLVGTLPAFDIQDVQGVELYYNAEITPWFHLTGDFQVVANENDGDDPAVILGLRAKIDL